MVLTKDELIQALRNEISILLHLVSKVDPDKLGYRPAPKQRSLMELLRYLSIMGPIHARAVKADTFDMGAWQNTWRSEEAVASTRNLDQARDAIAGHAELLAELVGSCTDAELRAEIEMFGIKRSRGAMFVNLVLCHYVAYRMQLFLYLKATGREELNTLNLWAGRDAI